MHRYTWQGSEAVSVPVLDGAAPPVVEPGATVEVPAELADQFSENPLWRSARSVAASKREES